MGRGNITKIVYRYIKGRIVPMKRALDKQQLHGLKYTEQTLKNYQKALKLYKKAKHNRFEKAKMFGKGGIFDPVKKLKDKQEWDAYRRKDFITGILKKTKKDQFSQARAKKTAEKWADLIDGKGIFPKKTGAEHFTKSEVVKLSKKPLSKDDFWKHLDESGKYSNTFMGDAAEVLSPYGAGKSAISSHKNMIKFHRRRLANQAASQVPRGSALDRRITAKGKGIKFVIEKGKLKPIRPKRKK
jgi:hypothetical protein